MLRGERWSLRNKLNDILKAKTLTEAQMNAYELAMRLQHLERALDEFAEQLRQGVCTVSGHPK